MTGKRQEEAREVLLHRTGKPSCLMVVLPSARTERLPMVGG
eukprot:CAMPEP_0206607174 /NCGR_PEP_ID=MMETSP0325_2-20121206/51949_1 /ASSEMBLY_ACC=CAM_ASM_000347 /TAXON_ID=2866 /ORGANISM="Crypthecodinium cohnii, Strain Seligo" /LENGTH=40 /DNA_ID= /DNA_START= /DNA_END= /DNA_ORIENTATION=